MITKAPQPSEPQEPMENIGSVVAEKKKKLEKRKTISF